MKIKKPLIIVSTILLLGVVSLFLFADRWAENILSDKIKEISFLEFDSIELNLAKGKLSLFHAKVNLPSLTASANKVSADGINIFQLIAKDKVVIDNIDLNQLKINYFTNQKSTGASNKSELNTIPEVLVKNLIISESKAALFTSQDLKRLSLNFSLTMENITNNDVVNPYQIVNKINALEANNLVYLSKNNLYKSGIKSLELLNNNLQADSIYLTCNFEKYELGRHVRHEIDWYNLHIDSVSFSMSTLERLIKHHETTSVKIYKPNLLVFRDKRLPFPKGKKGKLLKEILNESSFSAGIDSIEIINGKISYQEYVKSGDGPGEVVFDKLNATIENLYTYNKRHDKPPRLRANTALYNQSTLYADVIFPLDKAQSTVVKGHLMPMKLDEFNKMLKYVAFTELEEGYLDSLSFEFSYTDNSSRGQMRFGYHDLKIDFLHEDNTRSNGFFNELRGFVANTFVVNKNNPESGGKFRIGEIKADRNPEKSMFNFWWESILSGFRSSTGVKPPDEKINTN